MPAPPARQLLARLVAWTRWHRRPVAVALVALALLLVVRDLRPAPAPATSVVVATRDLDAGTDLTAGDVEVRRVLADHVPDHALTTVPVERVLALPVRRGEILTDVRLLATGLLGALSASATEVVAAPVHLADAETAALLRVGDSVDVLGAGPAGATTVAARSATVLLAPTRRERPAFGSAGAAAGGVVVLGVSNDEALALARAAATDQLSVVVRAD